MILYKIDQEQNTYLSNGIISEMKSKRQHKDYKNTHIIEHIRHTDKTAGDIKIHRFTQIPHGMVGITHKIRLRGSANRIQIGIAKEIQMIPHRRNLSLSSYGR
jgi:hypothetical protein